MALDEIRKTKLDKIKKLRKAGIDPYPANSGQTSCIRDALGKFEELAGSKLGVGSRRGEGPSEAGTPQKGGNSVEKLVLTGRILARREHGGSVFFDINDGTEKIQAYIKEDVVGSEEFKKFNEFIDIGDFVAVEGHLFKTKKDEKTIEAISYKILAKALLPLPEKWHGLQDVEERFRKRYLDLLMNPEIKDKFIKRSRIIQAIRDYLIKHNFIEVTTPTLQSLYGGASARPFKTHINALNVDMFLRIAPELYLKRLLVGGFERVCEFTTNFRNEGMDRDHNPEFSAVEFYAAYRDYRWAMDFVEDMLVTIAPERFKKPFRRVSYGELMKEYGSLDDTVFKEKAKPTLIEPTFVMDYPKDTLPLTKLKPGTTDIVEAFQFCAGGIELAKAFTELNDPVDQRERFKAQEKLRAKGDEEAQQMDEDFVEALEYGMPPAAGVGIGLDRLVAFLTGSHSIREVILFPLMKSR